MKLQFTLPKANLFSLSDNYAVNLRRSHFGLCPTACPSTRLNSAGAVNFRLADGRILSVGDDMHELLIDGESVGALSSPFGALLPDGPDGTCAVLTVGSAPEWLVDGRLRGPLSPLPGEVTLSAGVESEISATIDPLSLSGSYPRASGTLSQADCLKAASALRNGLEGLEQAAATMQRRVQPVWMAWQIKDSGGKVIFRSEPQLLQSSAGFQGTSGVEMTLTRGDGKFTDCSSGTLKVKAYAIRLQVKRADDDWRRKRAARLEILASEPLQFIKGATGAFNAVNSSTSALYISPLGADAASTQSLLRRSRSEFAENARVVLAVDSPLEGADILVGTDVIDSAIRWADTVADPYVTAAHRSGSAIIYASASSPGSILCARAESPLAPSGSAKVANGRILRICSPAGSGGGWNYGRHHILVFATDGVYAVSIDRTLSVISSSLIHPEGINRTDAVTEAVGAIYFCTPSGSLLRLRGSVCSRVDAPIKPVALSYVSTSGELWLAGADMTCATIDAEGGCSLRNDLHALRFDPGTRLAVDSSGALRDLDDERPAPLTLIEWRRRLPHDLQSAMVEWRIESANLSAATLQILADGGATPLPVTTLKITGAVNAPLRYRLITPPRPYLTVSLSARAAPRTTLSEFLSH